MSRLYSLALCVASVVCLCLPVEARSQAPTAAQQALVQAELEKRGLTLEEARQRLVQEGIILENIPLAELPSYRPRILAILDALAAEKRGREAGATPAAGATSSPQAVQTSTVAEASADAQQRVLAQLPDTAGIFGHSIFVDQTLDVFRTTDGARAPDTYVLGAGDQLRVMIFGASQADLLLEVSPDGHVQPNGVPRVFLQGLTLAQARELLRNRLGGFYRFNSDQFALTIQAARTVTVSVFGESKIRGSFNVSALNSAFNALAAAGGPSEIGSVRAIELVRGTTRRRIDVYEFMSNPSGVSRLDIQHNDILFVPVAKTVVTLRGTVRRPMRYELIDGEGVRELIQFAGGVNFDTYTDFVQVQRVEGDEVVLREWRLADVLAGRVAVPLRDGDQVRLREIGRSLQKVVFVDGAVLYPGRYDLAGSQNIGSLLARAQLRPEASDLGFLVRRDTLDFNEVRYRRVSLRGGQVLDLQNGDSLLVFDRSLYSQVGELSVAGAVRERIQTNFDPGLTVTDLVLMAGGLELRADANRVDVFRASFSGDRGTTFVRIPIRLDSAFRVVEAPTGFRLMPFDQVVVRERPLFNLDRSIHIEGQVLYPGRYALASELVYLSDVLQQAGGLTELANADYASIRRLSDGVGTVGVDLREALRRRRDASVDPILLEGDSIVIARRENTVSIRLAGTRIGELRELGLVANVEGTRGAVRSFVYAGPRSAAWYVEQYAGGFGRKADRMSVTVTDPSGRVRGTRRTLLFFKIYPEVLPGSVIALQPKPEPPPSEQRKFDWDAAIGRSTQALTAILTLVLISQRL